MKIPVPFDIPNIIAVGLNYKDHASELNMPIPNEPVLFFKPTTTLNPHNSPIVLPRLAPDEVDYEAELGVIIKNKCKRTRPEEIMSNILGFTCINDITARDCALRRDRQWARGKIYVADTGNDRVVKLRVPPKQLPNSPMYIWQQFKAALKANDKTQALTYISDMVRDKYEPVVNALDATSINRIGELTFDSEDLYFYRCELSYTEDDSTITSYPVYFVRDTDGSWKICIL